MKQQQDRIRAAQPDALVFINLGPPGGVRERPQIPAAKEEGLLALTGWGSGGGAGSTHPPEKGYDSYISTVQPDILSLDTYPTFGNPHDPAAALCPLTQQRPLSLLCQCARNRANAVAVAGGLRDDGSPTSDTREAYLADLNVTRAAALKATHPTPWCFPSRPLTLQPVLREDKIKPKVPLALR